MRNRIRLCPPSLREGNRTNIDQLIRNEDGSYTLVETKLRSTTRLSKGQKAAKKQIKEGNGKFEVRSDELRDREILRGQEIEINRFELEFKYE